MGDARLLKYADVQWWPSPIHCAVMLQIGRDTFRDADPNAPEECKGMIRVRTTQAELSDVLNVTDKTIRRVFNDFRAMGIMRPAPASRTWYLHPNTDNAVAFAGRMKATWPEVHKAPAMAEEAAEVEWYEGLFDPPAPPEAPDERPGTFDVSGDATPARARIYAITRPTEPPSMRIRLQSAITNAGNDLAVDPALVGSWMHATYGDLEDVAAYLEASPYADVREWIQANIAEIRAFVDAE